MKFNHRLAALVAVAATGAANAATTPIDLSPITSAFSDQQGVVTAGIMAVAAILAVIYVSIKAAKIVLNMLRGG
ncbi:hypothetical protein [Ideonella sp.]|jgi:hypothetical protein|uniref:hypothetical protein n=1 Tax=Ideonella sp. TaxID=1929293 RepID=UPI0037BE8A9F